ncbi:MAG TPA: hypothetical protein VFS20_09750 [Longimicrobium sp.]|nr:hypothetical protein [Longimicrobium sp.]
MIVTVFGSISIKTLVPAEHARVVRLMELGAHILVSDAWGVNLAVQQILARAGYRRVTVYHCGVKHRHNVGNWQTIAVRGRFEDKDRAMCSAAEYGLAIWDGVSRGTSRNVKQLRSEGKRVREVDRTKRDHMVPSTYHATA